jgi:hypothetical protein
MLLILIVLVALGEARYRFIQQNKDAINATNIAPEFVIDPGYNKSVANKLLNAADVEPFNEDFKAWMISTWGINVTAGIYDPTTTGYYFTNGYTFPTTIIDPQHRIIYDSAHPNRGRTGEWTVSVSAWYVGFTTNFTVASGTNAGAYVDPESALMYLKFFFLKTGEDWSNPKYKETMPCQTDETARFFDNQYIKGGIWGGQDDVIRYTCFDITTIPASVCNKYEINVYRRHPDETVDETARVTYMCA